SAGGRPIFDRHEGLELQQREDGSRSCALATTLGMMLLGDKEASGNVDHAERAPASTAVDGLE
ncbi:MAG: hypothetical protein AB7Q27_25750, partial [Acidimicrobiia bacterium]